MNRRVKRVAGVLLAAGASTRMGKTKQLLPLGEKTLIERVLVEALNSELDKVVLVLGYQAGDIKKVITPQPKLSIIENRQFKQGISSSIIAGLSEIENTHDHVMILLGDMPFIHRDLINLLLRRYLQSGLPIGAIKGKDRPVHPMIFGRELYPELLILRGDVGARALFRKYRDQVCLIEPEGPYDGRDIDTPEDYAGIQISLKNQVDE
ncbi:MAG: nucleotidyltransferase family protein [Desulfobacteraceae bacterium]|nr:nucleotidyltransferase family protein [Desulfobacteraceae bacterium]